MQFIIRYTDKNTKEQKEIVVEAAQDVLSVTLPPQPDEGIVGVIVNINSDGVNVKSHNGSKLHTKSFNDMIAETEFDKQLDPEDKRFLKLHTFKIHRPE